MLASVIFALFVYFPVQTYGEGSNVNVRLCVSEDWLNTNLQFNAN